MKTELVKGSLRFDPIKQKWFLGERKMSGGLMGQLSDELRRIVEAKANKATTIVVEYDLSEQNQISNIREEGKAFAPAQAYAPEDTLQETGDFHNPYNFIPALPRGTQKPENLGELGDHSPAGHASYGANLWSGRITVKLTTASPLLIPDAANVEKRFVPEHPDDETKAHKVYQTRIIDGKPYLPPTSIKGMLRSAYEAVTNSRLSVFAEHSERLAYRMPANDGLKMVPARIMNDRIFLYTGTSQIGNDGCPKLIESKPQEKREPMFAAWLRRYGYHRPSFQDRLNGRHKQEVWAFISLWRHRSPHFDFWNVIELRDGAGTKPDDDDQPEDSRNDWNKASPVPHTDKHYQKPHWVKGYVCVTGKNIRNKHDERVFFHATNSPESVELTPTLKTEWKKLIEDYAVTDHAGLDKGIRLSQHINNASSEKNMPNDSLCYAQVNRDKSGLQVTGLFPVMISRKLHRDAPQALLESELQPATNLKALSPADRVFGWVKQNGNGAYRGQLRISNVECLDEGPPFKFPAEVPLSILGQPKPQQVRFYAARSSNGESWAGEDPPIVDKGEVGYWKANGNGLRGRKVYPHHAGAAQIADYWKDPHIDRTQEPFAKGFYQEYRRTHKPELIDDRGQEKAVAQGDRWKLTEEEQQDSQNRTIKDWVQPNRSFRFDVHVSNLSDVELGALLWLLDLPRDPQGNTAYFHRLGGGKPLGFGSVALQIEWEQTELGKGQDWATYYTGLDEDKTPAADLSKVKERIEEFKKAVKKAYSGSRFEEVPFIAAFLRMARGFKKPIHYPRTRHHNMNPAPPHPQGLSYEWFVANERTGRNTVNKESLTDLEKGQGLTIYLEKD